MGFSLEYKVLYRKYRPNCFKNIIGQDYTIKMLQNAIIHDKIAHSYLFTGPRGTGKTSTAKVFAKTINCQNVQNGEACGKCPSCLAFDNSPDIIEIDAASNNGVDDIRELINNVKIAPTEGKYKIYIIDEVHMMTTSAFNALLLTLEEPPQHAIFIMATTNVESVPITILSRCQRFNFKKISLEDLISQIKYVCQEEKIDITDDAVTEIAYLSEGGMRDALSLLDQLASSGEKITLDKLLANYGSISLQFIRELLTAVANRDVNKIHESIVELQNTSSDYKVFIKKVIQELSTIAVQIRTNTYNGNFTYDQVKQLVFSLNDCLNKINIQVNPFTLIEILLLDSFDKPKEKNVDNYMENVDKILDKAQLKKKETVPIKEQKLEKVEKEEEIKESSELPEKTEANYDTYLEELIKIRLNNCFAGAKKENLLTLHKLWPSLTEDFNLDTTLKSFLLDTQVVAASSDYAILTAKLESTVHLVNKNLALFDDLESLIGHKVHFIALSEEKWNQERQIYAKTIKSGGSYSLISEESLENLKPQIKSDIEEIVTNVFNHDKIEIV